MTTNLAHSVHQRLLNLAREQGRPFQELLQHYALERFLYRLGTSPYVNRFVLKGALMFRVWTGPLSRSTRDIDLLGHLQHSVGNLVGVVRAICEQLVVEDDGLVFHADTVEGEVILESAEYSGVRIRFLATLGKARVPLRVDVGFGDIIVPGPVTIQVPTLLDFSPPVLQGYSKESVIAEKLQAMVYLGEINSRMKDFYDIWALASRFAFDGLILSRAIRTTFEQRVTTVPAAPLALSRAFATRPEKQKQWRAFARRQNWRDGALDFETVVRLIQEFLGPVVESLSVGQQFAGEWPPGGPWAEVMV